MDNIIWSQAGKKPVLGIRTSIRSRTVPLTNGYESGRPKNMRIRTDPQNCKKQAVIPRRWSLEDLVPGKRHKILNSFLKVKLKIPKNRSLQLIINLHMTYCLTVVMKDGGDKRRQTDRHRVVAVLHLVGIPAQPGHNSLQHS
jgi:hypothetical protein